MPRSPKENPKGYRHPGEINLNYEDVEIKTSDGIILRGWFTPSSYQNLNPTIVYLHENAGNIGGRTPYMKAFKDHLDVNVLLVAYRGYSDSEG